MTDPNMPENDTDTELEPELREGLSVEGRSILPIHPDGGNKLPVVEGPSILPIYPDSETNLPTIGEPTA